VGVIEAHRLARKFVPGLQLVLAGGTATDDPEGDMVLQEVRQAAGDDPDIKILLLPPMPTGPLTPSSGPAIS
jgi:trehalose synthase